MHKPAPRFLSLALMVTAAVACGLPSSAPGAGPAGAAGAAAALPDADDAALLDAPLLFVKRHPYMAAHIYDSYYTWHPGGGIYVIENPSDPPDRHRVRAVIDPCTPETLGFGVYRDPDISWDARRVLFAFKGQRDGDTSIYEIGIDGRGLRRLTDPGKACTAEPPPRYIGAGRHDVNPCYLPDGRIVFTSTRQAGRVPCFNSEVDTLHVMNADGGDVHPISVNNVTEFDPAVLPDGRILYGRWEYVDKTALYMQSLWTIFPDGTNETALFANNLAKPTALLQARPVPGTHLVAAALTPHNGQAVGAIAVIDPQVGKNDLLAVTNFTPEYPTEMDQGLARGPSDPWPLSAEAILISNNAKGHGVIELVRRSGRRRLVHAEPGISCYAPMLVKPRPRPPVLAAAPQEGATGRFFVQDVHHGLAGVAPGEVKYLRIVEETTRISGIPPGGRWWNQAFLVSWQGSYVVKNVLGHVPVAADGSAFFEAPSGRALYFQAMDERGRVLQSMRTFVAAVPGVTRSCIGCHEDKMTSPTPRGAALAHAPERSPDRPRPEAWGSGYLDYPTMVQPVLDEHCVRCHGGRQGIAGGLDLSGGWTWAFSISYETLLKNTLAGFLNCNNASVGTSRILPPRMHGSSAAPLAEVLLSGHKGRIGDLTEPQRAMLLAWLDTNCNYYGTYDWTPQATCEAILAAGAELAAAMRPAGCTQCHAAQVGDDWINLRDPEQSRILRAPLAAGGEGLGLGWCRDRKARAAAPLVTQRRQPPDVFKPVRVPPLDPNGRPVATFASTGDAHYQAMLGIIRRARSAALASPRVDMPGAQVIPGQIRMLVPQPLPASAPGLAATLDEDGGVRLRWERSAATIGQTFEVHRGEAPDFAPADATRLAVTSGFAYADALCPPGQRHYALVAMSGDERSAVGRASLRVPQPTPPPAPQGLTARGEPGQVALAWRGADGRGLRYHVYRTAAGGEEPTCLTAEPLAACAYVDAPEGTDPFAYHVRAVSPRGAMSDPSDSISAAALPQQKEPVFTAFDGVATGALAGGATLKPRLLAGAKAAEGGSALDLAAGGHAAFDHQRQFDVGRALTVECRVRIDRMAQMPVIASCGAFNDRGWFIQAFGGKWRWHVGGASCDGGRIATGQWVHLACTFDGREARIYQDGRQVAAAPCSPNAEPWPGPLVLGQYSQAGPQYQVFGQIAGLKLYRRALTAADAAEAAKATGMTRKPAR